MPSGKLLPHDPSSRVPLIVRGPGLPAAATSRELVGNVDLAPTILELANATPGRVFDGRSLLPFARDPSLQSRRPLLHETSTQPVVNYKAVRTDRWLYVKYEGGELELYDLRADPHQLESLHADPRYRKVRADLGSVLKRLQDCAGRGCRTPVSA